MKTPTALWLAVECYRTADENEEPTLYLGEASFNYPETFETPAETGHAEVFDKLARWVGKNMARAGIFKAAGNVLKQAGADPKGFEEILISVVGVAFETTEGQVTYADEMTGAEAEEGEEIIHVKGLSEIFGTVEYRP